jgi:replication factor C subunit 3/5
MASQFLWVDKHSPKSLSKLTLHDDITAKLTTLAHSEELPHLLIYGPPGVGKKTRVMALLREIFGAGVEKIKLEHRAFKLPSNKMLEINMLGSNYHIECNPSDAGNNDKYVVQEVIKEIASHTNLSSSVGGGGTDGANSRGFKVVILTEVDRLSRQAQAGLRRTMEKYSSSCRLILISNSPSKIIEPVRSRCLGIRIPSSSTEAISNLLVQVARKEGLQCPIEVAMNITLQSDRNIRRALLMLETAAMAQGSNCTALPTNIVATLPDWEVYCHKVGGLERENVEEDQR